MRLSFCVACGSTDTASLEHHHFVPKSLGGSDDDTNIITLCSPCHGRMHSVERLSISHLTKAALQAAKARGVTLGGDRGQTLSAEAQAKGRAVLVARASDRAADVAGIISEVRAGGAVTLREIAAGLNSRGIPTAKGGTWSAVQVSRVLAKVS